MREKWLPNSFSDLPWTGCCQWGKFDVNQTDLESLPPCDFVGTWPGRPVWGKVLGRARLASWQGVLGCGMVASLPSPKSRQNPVFSVYVKLRFSFHRFLQQILQGKNHFYLLLPAAAYAGMSPPQGHSRAGTPKYYHWLCPWKGLHFQVFPQSSSFQWLNLFCVILMPALHLPGCQLPRPSQGRELPKEALVPWDMGSWRSHFWETQALL